MLKESPLVLRFSQYSVVQMDNKLSINKFLIQQSNLGGLVTLLGECRQYPGF